jgi:hypothetical protein
MTTPRYGDWLLRLTMVLVLWTGGYAGGAAEVQVRLDVAYEGNQVVLRWPTNAAGYVLQHTDRLPGVWSNAPGSPTILQDLHEWRTAVQPGARFFRLARTRTVALPAVMGLVLDSSGSPVRTARVGGRVLTDGNGVGSGAPETAAAGWFEIEALGYTTGYARREAMTNGTSYFNAWLTPFDLLAPLDDTNLVRLAVGAEANPLIQVSVRGDDVAQFPVHFGLAQVNPLDVGPLAASVQNVTNVTLRQAFSVQAFDTNWDAVPLKPGRSIVLEVRDDQGSNPPPFLARFEPAMGHWMVLSNACQRVRPDVLACTLTELAPLYGLWTLATGSAPGGAAPKHRTKGPEDDYKQARWRFDTRARQIDEAWRSGHPVDPGTDAALQAGLESMAEAALAYANAHRDESGKLFLARVIEQATRLNRGDLVSALGGLAQEIAEEIASRLLADGDCGRISEMLHAMEQLMLMGGSEALMEALRRKVEELWAECDLWVGTITYEFYVGRTHPGLEDYPLESSGGNWREEHSVQMATHAKTLVLTGDDRVKLRFPRVKYQMADVECEMSFSFYGDPSATQVDLQFDGTYDGNTFSVGSARPASYTRPVSVVQHLVMRVEDEDGNCVNAPTYPITLPFPNYHSALVHGFLSSPPITLQEMLEEGVHRGSGLSEIIGGGEPITNDYPMPNAGRYPFTRGYVSWRFFHVQALLPLQP